MHRPKVILCSLFIVMSSLTNVSLAANSLSQFGITWIFDKELSTDGVGDTYQYGQFANGDYWVVVDSGTNIVNITGITPASVSGGREMHGAMINPIPGYRASQGWDSSINDYESSLNVALNVGVNGNSVDLSPGSSLVSAISFGTGSTDPLLRTAAVLTALNSAPANGSFRPAYAGNDKTIRFNKTQLDYSLLRSLTIPQAIHNLFPSFAYNAYNSVSEYLTETESHFERPWIDHHEGWGGGVIMPAENMPNYGRDISDQVGEAALMLHMNFTNQEKETLLIRLVQVGIDLYGLAQNGLIWPSDGGHASGRKWPILFAGIMLDDSNMKNIGQVSGDYLDYGDYGPGNPPPNYVNFGEDDQTFFVAAENIGTMVTDPYNGPTHYYGDDTTTSTVEQYVSGDVLLPEWGIRHATLPQYDRRNWSANYRGMHNVNNWGGFLLAAHMMEETASAKTLWNHNALFDYIDRVASVEPGDTRYFSAVIWEVYRDQYGCVWTRDNQTDMWSNGSNPCNSDDTVEPLPPNNLLSTSQTTSSINLSWTAPGAASDSDLASSYRIYRDATLLGTATTVSYEDTGLTAATSYDYLVYSVDDAGNQSLSAASATFVTADAASEGTVHYISTTGSSTNSGADWNNAWRQLPATLDRAHTYYVADGTYSGYNFDDAASGADLITVKKATVSDHGTSVGWLDAYGDGTATFSDVTFSSTSYVVFDGQAENGFAIEKAGLGGVAVDIVSSSHITLKYCNIDGNFETLTADEPSSHTNGACHVLHMSNVSYVTVEGCKLHDAADDGFEIHTADNLSIVNNEVYNLYGASGSCQGHSDGIEAYNVTNSNFVGNLIYDIRSTSAFFFGNWASSASDYCENITLANNIFYSPETGFAAYIEDVDNIRLYNNTFWGTAKGVYGGLSIGQNVTNMDMYNNIILSINYTHVGGVYNPTHHRGNYNLFGVSTGQYTENTNDIINPDPQFENMHGINGPAQRGVTIEDFRLTSSSPCVNTGTTIGFAYDIYENTRPQGTAYDIGPVEFTGTATQSYNLSIDITGSGSVTKTPDKSSYSPGESVSLLAVPGSGYDFTYWSGDASGSNNPETVSVNSDKTITAVFASSTPDTNVGVVGYWKFDDASGTSAADFSGNNNTGTLIGGPTWTTGKVGGALNFDGTDDAVQIGTDNLSASAGTIAFWIYPEAFADSTQYVFSHTTQPWANRIQLYTDDTSGNLDLGLGDSHTRQTNIQDLDTNTWYHITLAWNTTNYIVYIDGQSEASGTYTGLSSLQSYADIGNNGNRSATSEAFNGIIDEVRAYNRALTSTEVLSLYNSGSNSGTNNAPVLASIGGKPVNENALLTFVVTATDEDGDTLTYSAQNLPTGASFDNQIFEWTPNYSQAGTHNTTFIVNDGLAQDSEEITITVNNINREPVLTAIGDKSVNEGSPLTIAVAATDPDGDSITYSVDPQPTGATLSGQAFTWTPGYDQAGTYSLTFTASDGSEQDTETITITVNNADQPLTLDTIGDKSVNEASALTVAVSATDPDGESITYSVDPLPTGAAFASQTFTWTPGYDQAGTYDLTFSASNGTEQDSETITVTVNNTNRPVTLDAIGDKSVNEASALTVALAATDPDDESITYSVNTLPTGAAFAGQTFTWTPGYDQSGTYSLTFSANDGSGQDTETITVTVNNTNRPVTLDTIGDKSVNEASILTIATNATDPDGDSITYSADPLPIGAAFTGQTLTWTPGYDQSGSYSLTFSASDGSAEDTETITITVGNTDRALVLDTIGDQSVYASETLTLSANATDPDDDDTISYSTSTLPSGATFANQTFSWTPTTDQAESYSLTFTATSGSATDSETITIAVNADTNAPSVTVGSPQADAIQVPLNNLINLNIADTGKGIDADSVTITVDDNIVYTGDSESYTSSYGICHRTGTSADYAFTYQPNNHFDFDQTVAVTVDATDLIGNAMTQHSYSFDTEMRLFGQNLQINSSNLLDCAQPSTVCDSSGNIWALWHAGVQGQRDIYMAKLAAGTTTFEDAIQITTNSADQYNPSIAIDSDDKLYVTWQDNRYGNWDVYVTSSADGSTWATQIRLTSTDYQQTNPVVAVDNATPKNAYIAWQDDTAGNQDIYVMRSTDAFISSRTLWQVTSNAADQSEMAAAVDATNIVYLLWTDARNGNQDIYGATSATGPWTNVPVITNTASQSQPAVAAEAAGSILHLLWTDDTAGNNDIYYTSSNGLPTSPLTGTNVVDSTDDDQQAPAIAVAGSADDNLKVFACWQDSRNVSADGDTDLYFYQTATASGQNIFVGDDSTNSNQSIPAMGIDTDNYPYLIWVDNRNTATDIYYAASTSLDTTAIASAEIPTATGGTVGTAPDAINDEDDVSVIVPAGAYASDITIEILSVENPPAVSIDQLSEPYEFSPSGITFDQPVTVTIPYATPDAAQTASVYWYNTLTASVSQEGISDIEIAEISPTLHALSFKTTHFTQFFVGSSPTNNNPSSSSSGDGSSSSSGDGSGGGCSVSSNASGNILEYLFPYAVLAMIMITLKLNDARNRKTRNILRNN